MKPAAKLHREPARARDRETVLLETTEGYCEEHQARNGQCDCQLCRKHRSWRAQYRKGKP